MAVFLGCADSKSATLAPNPVQAFFVWVGAAWVVEAELLLLSLLLDEGLPLLLPPAMAPMMMMTTTTDRRQPHPVRVLFLFEADPAPLVAKFPPPRTV